MDKKVCQGRLSSLLTYNFSTNTLPKWIEATGEGYQIGDATISDIVYVNDMSFVMMLVVAMQ